MGDDEIHETEIKCRIALAKEAYGKKTNTNVEPTETHRKQDSKHLNNNKF